MWRGCKWVCDTMCAEGIQMAMCVEGAEGLQLEICAEGYVQMGMCAEGVQMVELVHTYMYGT